MHGLLWVCCGLVLVMLLLSSSLLLLRLILIAEAPDELLFCGDTNGNATYQSERCMDRSGVLLWFGVGDVVVVVVVVVVVAPHPQRRGA